MARIAPAPYRPERISPPGETIRDILEEIGMSQAELARRMGRPINKINQIVQGRRSITADTALELESVLALPASFWLNREQNYQLAKSAQTQLQVQQESCEVAKKFPCAEMAKHGWMVKKTTWLGKYQELLSFFGTAKLNALTNAVELAPSFRKADGKKASQEALAAWLRKGVIESQKIVRAEFCKQRVIDNVQAFRELTHLGSAGLTVDLPSVAAAMGIAVVFVPHLKGTYVGGAAYWRRDMPVIQLSFRWKRHDILWFNFFHELGHIVLHSRHETFLDDFSADQDEHEAEANNFAGDTLIPTDEWEAFADAKRFSAAAVECFSQRVGIAASIVVGRLHKEKFVHPTKLRAFQIAVSD